MWFTQVLHRFGGLVWRRSAGCVLYLGKSNLRLNPYSTTQPHHFRDTIYALASGQGVCGVAVIRVSGPMTCDIAKKMGALCAAPQPRQAILRTFVDPKSNEKLDSGLLLWFPGPHSFTGEDCLELQVHGGKAVISAICRSLSQFPDTRHAEAGEFTKRAFLNSKLDITEVEGLADVIHAETEAQRRQAFRQMRGELAQKYSTWRSQAIKNTASVEAFIDFSEEENIEDDVIDSVRSSLQQLIGQIRQHLADGRRGERLRDGVHVAIIGEANVGKSSLINYLTNRDVAIVSPFEGTTRDLIETRVNIGGYPALLVDTAGLRVTKDLVEKEGVRRAISRSQESDLILIMIDITRLESLTAGAVQGKVLQLLNEHFNNSDELTGKSVIVIVNKTDLHKNNHLHRTTEGEESIASSHQSLSSINKIINQSEGSIHVEMKQSDDNCSIKLNQSDPATKHSFDESGRSTRVVFTSLISKEGLSNLVSVLTDSLRGLCGDPLVDSVTYTQSRHRHHLTNTLTQLETGLQNLDNDVVITAENLRLACEELGQVTGRINTEDILDVIFKDFCIGK